MQKQQGFTLIELMIVVAIIGILAAIAIPQYQNYVARSQMSEAMTLASGQKTAVSEAYAQTGDLSGLDSGTHGIPADNQTSGEYVDSVQVTDGVIAATMKDSDVSGKVKGATLKLSPDVSKSGSIAWQCTGTSGGEDGAAGDIDQYLPEACRGS